MFNDIILNNLPQILTVVVGIAVVWKYLSKVVVVLKEVAELLNVVCEALADKKLTKDEIDQIRKEFQDIPAAIKDALNKQP